MQRTSLSILLLACGVASAAAAPESSATAPPAGYAQATVAPEAEPRTTIATAVRRTAVADPNIDGEVTGAEAGRYYETRFRLLDGDRDGAIGREEFLRTAIVRAVQVGGSFTPPPTREFESIDLDGDGALTPEEFLRASLMKQSWSSDGSRAALFDAVDTDRDGTLSKREFMAAGARDFERSDADGDGKVTIWEFYGGTSL
jgi:hypothetical protein